VIFQLCRLESLPAEYKFMDLKKGQKYRLALTAYKVERGIPSAEGFVMEEVK